MAEVGHGSAKLGQLGGCGGCVAAGDRRSDLLNPRLQLVSLVAANGEVHSCDLEAPLARSQPTISHHTKVLVDAGLLTGRKDGRWTWWSLAPGRLAQVRAALGG